MNQHNARRGLRRGLAILALIVVGACAAFILRSDERPSLDVPDLAELYVRLFGGAAPLEPAGYPRGLEAAGPGQEAMLAEANAAAVGWHRQAEAPYYPGLRHLAADDEDWPAGLPRTCVTLSSGGLRSAALGIGALQGLEQAGLMDRVDLVSGVSGGAFVILWLHGHSLLSGAPPAELLADGSEAVRAAEAHPELTSRYQTVLQILRHAATTPGRLGSLTIRALVGQSGPYASDLGQLYAAALQRIFLDTPDAAGGGQSPSIGLEELRAWMAEQRPELPFPVINASIGTLGSPSVCRTQPDGRPWLTSPVPAGTYTLPFEITPLRIGNDAIGYTDAYGRGDGWLDFTHFDLARAVATSGAAIDTPSYPNCSLADAVGGVGTSILDLVTRPVDHVGKENGWGVRRQALHLTDGGYTDRLAGFSAIKRLCQRVVVVDSGFDPYLIFDSYVGLKHLLAVESGVDAELRVPEIDAIAANNRDVCGDTVECWPVALERCPNNPSCVTSDTLPKHVFRGTVGPFPFPGRPDGLTLDVVYLKLGVVMPEMADYPASVRQILERQARYRGTSRLTCIGGTVFDVDCPFPQDTLLQLGYDSDRFRAYREFGRFLAAERLAPALKAPLQDPGASAQAEAEAAPSTLPGRM
jgi:hypothetical protein